MERYAVECFDRYDMEPHKDGLWVMYDDALAAISAAVAAERERCAKLCDAQFADRQNSRDERYMAELLAEAIREAR